MNLALPMNIDETGRSYPALMVKEQVAGQGHPLRLADVDDTEQLACTVVLLSVAGSDFRYCETELQKTYDLLEERFHLSPPQIHSYIERAVTMFEVFGRRELTIKAIEYLRANQSKQLHRDLFRMATEIAKADGQIVMPEVGWFRKFVRRMALTVADCKRALNLTPVSASPRLVPS